MDSYDKAYGVGSKYRTTHLGSKYRTTHFDVWRLDLKYCDSLEIPSCTLTEENSLGNEAIFVGRGASFSVPSSKTIKPNSIYFMDDKWQSYRRGGGCDMGIFDIEHRTIEPHFEGKPLDCISPPPPLCERGCKANESVQRLKNEKVSKKKWDFKSLTDESVEEAYSEAVHVIK
ncbi:hypothetical protein AgCh_023761, partial [Apium graveolens]